MIEWVQAGCLILGLVVMVPAFWLVLHYNLHMFQLNGYKNDEFAVWRKKAENQQRQRILLVLLASAGLFLNWLAGGILGILAAGIIWINYASLKRTTNQKKKLVFTARVKRLVASVFALFVLICALVWILFVCFGQKELSASALLMRFRFCLGILGIYTALLPVIVPLCNTINHPIEAGISQHYINDAKRRLASVPGLKIVGITGSYGKTSVKYYLDTLLSDSFNVLITPESFNTPMGVVRTIREGLLPSYEIFLCEMGARHVGDIKEICDFVHPHAGVITSIGPQHLETFFNMENIISTKYELADALPDGGMLFLNGDNEYILSNHEKHAGKRDMVLYASDGEGEYRAEDIRVSPQGTSFRVVRKTAAGVESGDFSMRLIGGHNVINVVGAIAVANRLGVPLAKLKVPVRRIEPVKHRLEMIQRGNLTIIDDAYNSNPVGSRAAVETLHLFDGVRILVTPGMVELGEKEDEYNYQFGVYAAENVDYILLVGEKHTEPIRRGALEHGFHPGRLFVFDDLQGALDQAYSISDEGHKYILLENDLPDQY